MRLSPAWTLVLCVFAIRSAAQRLAPEGYCFHRVDGAGIGIDTSESIDALGQSCLAMEAMPAAPAERTTASARGGGLK